MYCMKKGSSGQDKVIQRVAQEWRTGSHGVLEDSALVNQPSLASEFTARFAKRGLSCLFTDDME